jgi:hypothetical protein
MAKQIQSSQHIKKPQATNPEAMFLFGGYSWVKKDFQLWSISYRPLEKRFAAYPAHWLSFLPEARRIVVRKKKPEKGAASLGHIAFAGDQGPLATKLLLEKLNASRAFSSKLKPLDMEPFEVVRDMLRDPSHAETIGGAPQVVKTYQYMQTATLGVYWPDKLTGKVYLHGRACLGYERVDCFVLDPDTLISNRQPTPREPSVIPTEEGETV